MNIQKLYKLYKQHPVITTDSRECPQGSIFIALKGASFNGNKFAKMALEKGCSYAIIDEKEYAVQVNSKMVCRAMISTSATEEEVRALALALPEVSEKMAGKCVKKCIVVPGRLVNLIVG